MFTLGTGIAYMYRTCMRIHVRTCKHTGDIYCVPVLSTCTHYWYAIPVRTCKHKFFATRIAYMYTIHVRAGTLV